MKSIVWIWSFILHAFTPLVEGAEINKTMDVFISETNEILGKKMGLEVEDLVAHNLLVSNKICFHFPINII